MSDERKDGCGHDWPTSRDYANLLLREVDVEAQLLAIKGILRRNQQDEERTRQEIRELDAFVRNEASRDMEYQAHLEGHWTDQLQESVFQDAAHSMAAVGMLAPFTESIFVSLFAAIKSEGLGSLREDGKRRASHKSAWDPRKFFEGDAVAGNTARGIVQLAKASGFHRYLPSGYEKHLNALFSYRNLMFHNGFEWPLERRRAFARQMSAEGWPDYWFECSQRNMEAWIYYMSSKFIAELVAMLEEALDGLGRFYRDRRGH